MNFKCCELYVYKALLKRDKALLSNRVVWVSTDEDLVHVTTHWRASMLHGAAAVPEAGLD